MNEWDDRRAEPRVRVDAGQLRLIDAQDQLTLGTLANLSSHGLMLHSAAPFIEQASYQALLCWPDGEGVEQQIALGMLALWCSPGPADSHWSGFEIIAISDPDQVRLDTLIAAISA